MRLLNQTPADEIHLTKDLLDHEIPRYAILSHTWGNEEVLYQDLVKGAGKDKLGYEKIRFCGKQAQENGIQYFWVDTCCIDKANSVELQEAINSMFRWYRDAARCYVYLADVSVPTLHAAADRSSWAPAFRRSRWFSRGWTLQELIAPVSVEFFSKEGVRLGTKQSLEQDIHNITGLPLDVLRGSPLSSFTISERLAWGGLRETTRKEDKAYSLLGIFGIHMPLIYGEGEANAFRRLRADWPQDVNNARDDDFGTGRPFKHQKRDILCTEDHSSSAGPPSDALKDELVDLLFFPQIDERLTSLTAAQGKTCQWRFPLDQGQASTGKSTLMKLLFEEVKFSTIHDPFHITLSFFFLARGTIEEKSTKGLYRSILYQMFAEAADLKASLDWMTSNGARGMLSNGWHDQALKQTLKYAVLNLGSRALTIFVDALDECDQNQVADMVCFFEELCEHAQDSGVKLRICLSSRHYPTVVIEKGVEITLEDELGHLDDIQQYINSKLRLGKTKHADSLRSEILEKSSGIFLWVVLVVEILNTAYLNGLVSISSIRNRLKAIPPGLNELFDMILARDGKNLDQLHICLRWILFASRPLQPQEFYFAVQLGLDKESCTYWDREDVGLDQMKMFVRTSTKGLAEVTRNASLVQFIHESVRDFLLGRYGTQWSGPSRNFEGQSHNLLRDCCLAQLHHSLHAMIDMPNRLPEGIEGERFRKAMNFSFPFLAYSTFNVLWHANSAQHQGMHQGDFLTMFPLPVWAKVHNAFERNANQRYTESVDLLYVLAEQNLGNLVRIHPRALPCFEDGGERYGPPILAAVGAQSGNAIKAFIKVRLDTEPPGFSFRALCEEYSHNPHKFRTNGRLFALHRKRTVLSQVVERESEGLLAFFIASGYRDAQSLLTTEGLNIDSKDAFGRTPLSWAVIGGHDIVVQLLLDNGAKTNAADEFRWTPLLWAVQNGHETIIQMLLNAGADIESKLVTGETPLCLAVKTGRRDVVKLLLDNGADIESRDSDSRTPLMWALQKGKEDILLLLLQYGADVKSKDKFGHTPLWWAASRGYDTVLRLLFDSGADMEWEQNAGQELVMSAAIGGYAAGLQLLIENGKADINAKDEDGADVGSMGQVLLSYAAENGLDDIAELLLPTGRVDVYARDESGQTPLTRAVRMRHESMILTGVCGAAFQELHLPEFLKTSPALSP
ncbi:hypothetical protein V8F20_012322 [Naviculisporaceae sp. PSN 640]